MSDFHGRSPVKLAERLIENHGISRISFLGDYDSPELFREILNFSKEYVHIPMKIIVGNHDFHFASGENIKSPLLDSPSSDYINLWKQESDKLLEKVLCPSSIIRTGKTFEKRKVLYVHAGLSGIVESPKMNVQLWQRLIDNDGIHEYNVLSNFDSMREQEVHLKFRGHDHYPIVFSQDIEKQGEIFQWRRANKVYLDKDRRHIISVPDYNKGNYVIFDEESSMVHFLGNSKP